MKKIMASFPSAYLITSEINTGIEEFFNNIERCLKLGVKLVQLRLKKVTIKEYISIAKDVNALCLQYDSNLIVNNELSILDYLSDVKGIHLPSKNLMQCKIVPDDIKQNYVASAACHNRSELDKADSLHLDFAILTPILQSGSHPNALYLGWDAALLLKNKTKTPLYAAGGLSPKDIEYAKANKFLGVAAINSMWSKSFALA